MDYQFIITTSKKTKDFLIKEGFSQITAPRGQYMFIFEKRLFTFASEGLNYTLTNKIMFGK